MLRKIFDFQALIDELIDEFFGDRWLSIFPVDGL